jgi:hypothetical protein
MCVCVCFVMRVVLVFTVFCCFVCTYFYCFVVLIVIVLCHFHCFVCTSVRLLPPGENPIAVRNINNNNNNNNNNNRKVGRRSLLWVRIKSLCTPLRWCEIFLPYLDGRCEWKEPERGMSFNKALKVHVSWNVSCCTHSAIFSSSIYETQ